jgi:hypothetical protein
MRLVTGLSFLFVVASSTLGCASAEKAVDKATDVATCRAKQAEAQIALRLIYDAQQEHKGAKNAYADTFGKLGIEPEEKAINYKMKIAKVSRDEFIAEANATEKDQHGDKWTINQDGKLDNVKDGCAQ